MSFGGGGGEAAGRKETHTRKKEGQQDEGNRSHPGRPVWQPNRLKG